jgi:hypothetical protein
LAPSIPAASSSSGGSCRKNVVSTKIGTAGTTDGQTQLRLKSWPPPHWGDTSIETYGSAQNLHSICAAPSQPLSTLEG